MSEIISTFDVLRKKYSLPSYEEMNKEYEIGSIEDDDLLIRNIRKKMTEKIEFIANILSTLIQPETEIANLHEVSFFDDKEKEEIIQLYKKLMFYYRSASRLVVDDSEEANAKFILEAHSELQRLKPKLIRHFDKLQECWTKDLKKEKYASYLG
ncbi:MAG: hypothetical protein KJ574_02740 [Nanoarchaeota archaeon]|nr:hypothetical protein [Nanoarchaeota archaeon]